MRRIPGAAVLLVAASMATAAPAAAQTPCDPFGPAEFAGGVPTPADVIGIDLGARDVTTAESDAYVAAVDAASDRVISGTLARACRAATSGTRSSAIPIA